MLLDQSVGSLKNCDRLVTVDPALAFFIVNVDCSGPQAHVGEPLRVLLTSDSNVHFWNESQVDTGGPCFCWFIRSVYLVSI